MCQGQHGVVAHREGVSEEHTNLNVVWGLGQSATVHNSTCPQNKLPGEMSNYGSSVALLKLSQR